MRMRVFVAQYWRGRIFFSFAGLHLGVEWNLAFTLLRIHSRFLNNMTRVKEKWREISHLLFSASCRCFPASVGFTWKEVQHTFWRANTYFTCDTTRHNHLNNGEIFVGKRTQKERERFCDVFLSQFIIWFSFCVSVETLTSSNFFVINVNALKIELVVPDTVTIRSGHDPSDMLIFAPDWKKREKMKVDE